LGAAARWLAAPFVRSLPAPGVALGAVTVLRMDHVGVVVDDLPAAIAFFIELGLELDDEVPAEGRWVDRIIALDGVRLDIAMMRTPDGSSRLELTKFHAPSAAVSEQPAPANTAGIRHISFAVDDIEDAIARLRRHGGEQVGELVQYEQSYLLCYLRGPAGIIVELAQKLG
jgi:catechol 2,3-dioxygenase-like lactoylglutathione lyase family enzyme